MDGYNQGILCAGHNAEASDAIQPEAPSSKTYLQLSSKGAKDSEELEGLKGQINVV